ncbi:MAG: hypothetical protein K0Q77_2396, partial [Anaerosporomusa subterranea]|nr:hypothetical protein [Anaerosporomusa subterranea]
MKMFTVKRLYARLFVWGIAAFGIEVEKAISSECFCMDTICFAYVSR